MFTKGDLTDSAECQKFNLILLCVSNDKHFFVKHRPALRLILSSIFVLMRREIAMVYVYHMAKNIKPINHRYLFGCCVYLIYIASSHFIRYLVYVARYRTNVIVWAYACVAGKWWKPKIVGFVALPSVESGKVAMWRKQQTAFNFRTGFFRIYQTVGRFWELRDLHIFRLAEIGSGFKCVWNSDVCVCVWI